MTDRTNSYRDYRQDQGQLDQQQLQQSQQYQYPSTDLQPNQTLSPEYVLTSTVQDFTYPTSIDTTTYDTDTYIQDVPTHSDYYGGTAVYYGPYKSGPSEYTDTTSFLIVNNTPGPATVGTFSSYVKVSPHNRRYSDNSNRTSGQGSDSPVFSVPGDGEWVNGSEYAVDKEAMQREDTLPPAMPHDPQSLLTGLYSPEPNTVFNPYERVSPIGTFIYPEDMEVDPEPALQQLSFSLPSRPAKVQNLSEDPWNPVEQRIPNYPSGFAGFAPSPGPMVEVYAEYESASATPSPEISKSYLSLEERSRSGRTSSAKGKEKDRSTEWDHTVVAQGGLKRMIEIPEDKGRKNRGVRTGALDPLAKEKAREIRKMRACWNCWVQKVPCSAGKTCARCERLSKKHFSPSAHQLCCRSSLKDYESTLFPEFMHAHLKKSKIEDLISEHTTKFLNDVIVVEVSTGAVFRPMRLHTNRFEPKTDELIQQSSLTPPEPDQASELVKRYSAPVGILGLSVSDMKKKCEKHIEEMIRNPQYPGQVTCGNISQLPRQILEIVCEYSAAKQDVNLLQDALKLHAIHYFMAALPTFSERSIREINKKVSPTSTLGSYLSSRLLNRQIKYAMNKLHHEITGKVLEDLERSLRTRSKDSWGPSFCAIMLLCLCIEHLQSAADIMVVCNIQEKGDAASYTRDQSWAACQELDEYPFQQCKKLFHDIYRSHKDGSSGGRGEKAFNPLKMVAEDLKTGLDSTTERMVSLIREVVCNSWDEIMDLADKPAMVILERAVHPDDIKVNNTGRLAAKFLKSCFNQDE